MLPNGRSVASPECSRRTGALSIGAEPKMLESQSIVAVAIVNLASIWIVYRRMSDHA
jgi:hypothetical protein